MCGDSFIMNALSGPSFTAVRIQEEREEEILEKKRNGTSRNIWASKQDAIVAVVV